MGTNLALTQGFETNEALNEVDGKQVLVYKRTEEYDGVDRNICPLEAGIRVLLFFPLLLYGGQPTGQLLRDHHIFPSSFFF